MKNVVVCLDGTWNSADSGKSETNVALLARSLQANSGAVPQTCLYLRGVGSTGSTVQRIVDGATGDGIDENILSAYMFICQNYEPGDRIFLFGFSRGAFSARSLSGLIGACSLLKRWSLDKVAEAWRYYREADPRRPDLFVKESQADIHENVTIRFLGVWDTVGALGVPTTILNAIGRDRYQFHDTSPSKIVETARHALAIDEFRDEFVPTLWTYPPGEEETKAGDILQVWFAGAHADVGGGYRERTLADIPLMWMATEAEKYGLQIDRLRILTADRGNKPLAPQHDSRQSWSRKDVLTPTLRRVLERDVKVGPFTKLFVPTDDDGNVLRTIGERIHGSVFQRYGQPVTVQDGDDATGGDAAPYRPKTIPNIRTASPFRVATG